MELNSPKGRKCSQNICLSYYKNFLGEGDCFALDARDGYEENGWTHSGLTDFDVSSNLGKMNDVKFFCCFFLNCITIFSFSPSKIKLSSFWEE